MIEIALTEGVPANFEKAVDIEMTKTIKHFEHELVGIRSGRAHASMVEDIKVSCYGGDSVLPLKNIASISTPDARSLLIQPWDQSTLSDIERSLKESDLGVSPLNDGNVLRIQLQEMSSDRREELLKILGKKQEESRVSIRAVRKHVQNFVRDQLKEKTVSEDFSKRLNDLLQKATDAYIKKIDELGSKKNKELAG
jgi:ribosome recycling factor